MSRDRVYYLDPVEDQPTHAFSRLREMLREAKQNAAPASQWLGQIRGLTQKGVKQAEIEDVGIVEWLERRGGEKVARTDLIAQIERQIPRIKVVDLANPKYSGWRSLSGQYTERMYVLTSEAMQIDDQIEDLFYRMEELGFDPTPLMQDPGLVDRLEWELFELKAMRPKSWDFAQHHFSESIKEHGKNLMVHARFVVQDDLFFIQEIQSDWAQQGRRCNWMGNFPKAPFVTQTEQWAGLVLKELAQTAARDPAIKRVAWLRSNMRNGWNQEAGREHDNLAEFYDNIVRRLAEKLLAKTDAKVQVYPLTDKNGMPHEVLGFPLTDKAREALCKAFPLYSRDRLMPPACRWIDADQEREIRADVLRECQLMLGSTHMVRFFNRLYDIASGEEVAGRYWNEAIEISMRAADPHSVARHEAMHFAYDQMLLPHERLVLDMAFFPGGELNRRTKELLLQRGLHAAAEECRDPKECAAYAFEFWCKGELDVHEEPRNVFERVVNTLVEIGNWIRRMINPQVAQTPEQIFEGLRDGVISRRERAAALLRGEEEPSSSEDLAMSDR